LTKLDYKNFAASKELRGVLLPVTTPFHTDGGLDVDGLRSNLRRWNQSGVAGYVVLGSTGERVHLDEREYLEVIELTRAEVPAGPNGLAFIVGAGQQSTLGSIGEVKKAAAAGADAVLVITPHFYRAAVTQEALVNHYLAVADASPVPTILYSMPAFTGINVAPETVARLSQHPNIIGVKDSSADVAGLRETVRLVTGSSARAEDKALSEEHSANVRMQRAARAPATMEEGRREFAILTGNGTVLYEALCAGASGAILAVGCVVPELCSEIFSAVQAGAKEQAAALQQKLTPLASAVTTKYGIGGLKAALDMIGYTGGAVRAPLRQPDEKAREEIAQALTDARAILTGRSHTLPGSTSRTPAPSS
jgi:4-hydroxy-2-oxoglutarate aldolase